MEIARFCPASPLWAQGLRIAFIHWRLVSIGYPGILSFTMSQESRGPASSTPASSTPTPRAGQAGMEDSSTTASPLFDRSAPFLPSSAPHCYAPPLSSSIAFPAAARGANMEPRKIQMVSESVSHERLGSQALVDTDGRLLVFAIGLGSLNGDVESEQVFMGRIAAVVCARGDEAATVRVACLPLGAKRIQN